MPERLRGFTTRRYIDQRYLYHYLYLLFDFASYHSCWLASNTTRLVQNLYSLPGEVLFVVACFCNFVTLFVSIITAKQLWNHVVNPLEYRGNCNAASSKMKSVHWTPWVGCYILYDEEKTGRGGSPPSPLLAVPNVTAHPSTASVSITTTMSVLATGYDGQALFLPRDAYA